MVKGIIFDLDGVYFVGGTTNFLDNVSSKFGLDRDKVLQVYLKSDKMQQYKRGEISGEEFWSWAIEELGIDSTKQELLDILGEGYEVNPLTTELLQKVRAQGIKAIICTNNFRERIELLESRFNFQKDFDHVVLSYKHGILKPDLLTKVEEISGFAPEDILIIDDGEDIIQSAKERGYQTILCEDSSKIPEYLKEKGLDI